MKCKMGDESRRGGRLETVSVVMSVYNAGRYLRRAVESILGQTWGDFEFIIINDGSTDDTATILGQYSDRRISVWSQANMGLTRSLNRGIRLAGGQYVVRMDADDWCRRDRIERQVSVFRSCPDVSFVATGAYYACDEGHVVERERRAFAYDTLPAILLEGNMLIGASVAFRRKAVVELGGYDERFEYAQDYELWLRASWAGYRFALVPEPVYTVRGHGDSISSRKRVVQRGYDWKARRETIRRLRCEPEAYEWIDRGSVMAALKRLSWEWRDAGDLRAAGEVVATMISLAPGELVGYRRAAALLRAIVPTRSNGRNRPGERNL